MSFDPAQHFGETVTVRGTAATARAGAMVEVSDGPAIYVAGLAEWADDVEDKQVEVTGTLRLRPSRLPQVQPGGVHSHGLGETVALDDASWTVLG
ncbi:MAG TPA: hypothetical protein VES42_25800 [Pilimelia sp.]|nr:hypothetical protein [Pilimelia sp.]